MLEDTNETGGEQETPAPAPRRMIRTSRIGEAMVHSELLLYGLMYPALGEEAFDYIWSVNRRLLRVQVKAAPSAKVASSVGGVTPIYTFTLQRSGANHVRRAYDADEVDIFAFVGLDAGEVAYIPAQSLVRKNGTIPRRVNIPVAGDGFVRARTTSLLPINNYPLKRILDCI